jgi:6-phosphogluconolactonase (cycloisomerase 2 family)
MTAKLTGPRRLHRWFGSLLLLVFASLTLAGDARAGFLYLLNDDESGNRIYGFSVNETTGALTPLAGFPVNAMLGGDNHIVSERMWADTANNRLYVINEVSDTVSAYSIDPATGAIAPLPFSPITLPTGGYDTLLTHPSGSPLLVANISSTTPLVSSFVITASSATPAVGSPFPFTGTSGFASELSVDGNYYYVGGNTNTNLAGFSVNSATGVLTTLPGSPFPMGAANSIAHAADASGRFFVVDSVDAIRAFTSVDGMLSPVTGNPFVSGLTQRRFGMMHPNQEFYIVAGNTGNNVGVFRVSGSGAATTVAPVPGSPFATGATTANVLALNASGTFLFVGNRISRSVTTFAMDPSTGVLTNLGSQPSSTLGTFGAINGIAYVPAVTVANADISGTVTTSVGPAGGTIVSLASSDNSIHRSTYVNSFGNYTFAGLPTGLNYTVTAHRKGTTFTPASRVINLTGNVSDADFAVTSK